MSRALYWRIPHRRSHRIESDKLMRLLELESCLDLINSTTTGPIYYTDLLRAICATIENYGSDTQDDKDSIEILTEIIEAIEKHGEIELFYEY